MAGTVQEKYTYKVNTEKDGAPESEVRIYALDSELTKVIDEKTDGGTIGDEEILAVEYTVTGTDTVASAVKNPHDIRALKYGLNVFQISKNVIQAAEDTFFLVDNDNTSYETSAAAGSGSRYINVYHDERLIRVFSDLNMGQIYDYMQVEAVVNPQPSAAEILSTVDGTTFNCIYDFNVSGASIDAAGKTLFMPTRVFSTSGGGTFSGKVTDINGTIVSLTLTGLVPSSEVRIYNAGVTDQPDLAGVENSGTTFTYQYVHVTDFDVDIVVHHVDYIYLRLNEVTLTVDGGTIPINQQVDRWYSNPA